MQCSKFQQAKLFSKFHRSRDEIKGLRTNINATNKAVTHTPLKNVHTQPSLKLEAFNNGLKAPSEIISLNTSKN